MRWSAIGLVLTVAAGLAAGCSPSATPENELKIRGNTAFADAPSPRAAATPADRPASDGISPEGPDETITVSSPAFAEGGTIPTKYTFDGANVSPPLTWTEGPPATSSYVLIMDDPATPAGIWTHWISWNIGRTSLGEDVAKVPRPGSGIVQGLNSWNRHGYGGPQPPAGETHTYFFRIYALDADLTLPPESSREELDRAMRGHVLARGKLSAKYGRTKD